MNQTEQKINKIKEKVRFFCLFVHDRKKVLNAIFISLGEEGIKIQMDVDYLMFVSEVDVFKPCKLEGSPYDRTPVDILKYFLD
jgi:hypothetical protein